VKKASKKPSKISIDFSIILLFLYSFLCGNAYIFCLYFISVILHELAHLYVAKKLGYGLDVFKFSITGASMKLDSEEFFLNDEFKIAIAGPLFNLFVFVLIVGMCWIIPDVYNYAYDFALVNLFIFLFNILPIYSLDGGRIVVCLFEKFTNRSRIVTILRYIGIVLSCLLFIAFLVSCGLEINFSLGVASVFLFLTSTAKSNGKYYKFLSDSKLKAIKNNVAIEQKVFLVSSDARLIDLYRKLSPKVYSCFIVVSKSKKFEISEQKLIEFLGCYGATVRLSEIGF